MDVSFRIGPYIRCRTASLRLSPEGLVFSEIGVRRQDVIADDARFLDSAAQEEDTVAHNIERTTSALKFHAGTPSSR
jgi:hypothetical protein